MKRPTPYDGNEPFIFISYSHKDSPAVWDILNHMIDDGYRVWYDDGINPGSEWDEFIATKISECQYFLAFISENYMLSDNCKDELNYARDQVENKLLVYLEDVSLPKGMEMRLGRIQAINKYNLRLESDFYRKLYSSNNINLFYDESLVKKEEAVEEVTPATESVEVVPAAEPVVEPVEVAPVIVPVAEAPVADEPVIEAPVIEESAPEDVPTDIAMPVSVSDIAFDEPSDDDLDVIEAKKAKSAKPVRINVPLIDGIIRKVVIALINICLLAVVVYFADDLLFYIGKYNSSGLVTKSLLWVLFGIAGIVLVDIYVYRSHVALKKFEASVIDASAAAAASVVDDAE